MPQVKVKCNWTQIPNTWLKDKNLSLKAKGLISVMQSLPDNWNFSVQGLASILKECPNTINAILQELEKAGYLTREQIRENGKIVDTLYTLHEFPHVKSSTVETLVQYNTNIQNTKNKKMSVSGSDEPSPTPSPFSSAVSKKDNAPAGAPDGAPAQPVTDIRKISDGGGTRVDGKVVCQLLKAGGKKDVVTPALVNLVRVQAKKYGGVNKLFEMVERVKFEPFYAKMGMMSLLADKNLSNIVNMDNEVREPVKKDWRYYSKLDRFDPERIKFFKEHPEYML